jgi:hypothetical protein
MEVGALDDTKVARDYTPLRNRSKWSRNQPGQFYSDGLSYLDKIPAWWKPFMTEMSPEERFRRAFTYARNKRRAVAPSSYYTQPK